MWNSLKKLTLRATSTFLIALILNLWAAPVGGAAHLRAQMLHQSMGRERLARHHAPIVKGKRANQRVSRLPDVIHLREVAGRGLLVKTWINDVGAYSFAVDTGAGATILSTRVAREARVAINVDREVEIGGLSGANGVAGREASLHSLAVGDRNNFLPGRGLVIVAEGLPSDIDGILDPTEGFWPLGYVIDIPHGVITAFDPHQTPLHVGDAPPDGTVVQWTFESDSRRPFVILDGGRRALLDTGSGFGLAINENAARTFGIINGKGKDRDSTRDLARGRITARRITATTVSIGPLVLRNVPTDLLTGASSSSPILLGRDALRPFELTFDPINRLIRLVPR